MQKDPGNLIWIDLEMTGLDTVNDTIIEIATIVTDKDLTILAEGPVFAIYQPAEILAAMDEWNTRQHNASGLVERVKNSSVTMAEAETRTLAFVAQYLEKGVSPMCGNSICQDRRFMSRLMPDLEAFFNYRNLDVSSLKELCRLWAPQVLDGFSKQGAHLALEDIRESIAELRYYRSAIMSI